jgi:hypothetical protein
MLLQMFTVYDSKAEAFLPPFFMNAKGSAIRSFADTCNDPQHAFYKHPDDYTLFHLGQFDDVHSTFDISDSKVPLGSAREYIQQQDLPLGDPQVSL